MNENRTIPPMFRHKYMAHALGGYRGYQLLNCEAAFRYSYQCGFRYFETDLKATADHKLVCSYGWNENTCERTGMTYMPSFETMTHELFMQQKIHGFPVLDAAGLAKLMKKFKDTYLEIDLKTLPYEEARYMAGLVYELFSRENLLDRILIQVNTKRMFEGIDSVYHFPWVQFNVREDIEKLDDFIAFCLDHDICALALKGQHAKQDKIDKINAAGLCTLVYTVDSRLRAERYHNRGANTVCTNFVYPGAVPGQRDDVVNIAYNSAVPMKEQYSDFVRRHILRGNVDTLPDGRIEYSESVQTLTNCEYQLTDCLFRKAFWKLSGWYLRGKKGREPEWTWYCTDEKWHTQEEIETDSLEKVLFENCGTIRLDEIFHRERMVFEACWVKSL